MTEHRVNVNSFKRRNFPGRNHQQNQRFRYNAPKNRRSFDPPSRLDTNGTMTSRKLEISKKMSVNPVAVEVNSRTVASWPAWTRCRLKNCKKVMKLDRGAKSFLLGTDRALATISLFYDQLLPPAIVLCTSLEKVAYFSSLSPPRPQREHFIPDETPMGDQKALDHS